MSEVTKIDDSVAFRIIWNISLLRSTGINTSSSFILQRRSKFQRTKWHPIWTGTVVSADTVGYRI